MLARDDPRFTSECYTCFTVEENISSHGGSYVILIIIRSDRIWTPDTAAAKPTVIIDTNTLYISHFPDILLYIFADTETCVPQIGEESDIIQQRKMKEKSDAGFETETDSDTVLV